jgi:hypothetical protein
MCVPVLGFLCFWVVVLVDDSVASLLLPLTTPEWQRPMVVHRVKYVVAGP